MTNETRWTSGPWPVETRHGEASSVLAEARRRWGAAAVLTGPTRPLVAPPPDPAPPAAPALARVKEAA